VSKHFLPVCHNNMTKQILCAVFCETSHYLTVCAIILQVKKQPSECAYNLHDGQLENARVNAPETFRPPKCGNSTLRKWNYLLRGELILIAKVPPKNFQKRGDFYKSAAEISA